MKRKFLVRQVEMDSGLRHRHSAGGEKPLLFRDVALAILAFVGVIFANVGVVRALDVALDVFRR